MVGGIVIETIDTGDRIWVNCKDRDYSNTCAIYIERTPESRSISEGDSIWWQGWSAFWTPSNNAFHDKKLRRTSFSGVERPSIPDAIGYSA
jgi:hypothetical protein